MHAIARASGPLNGKAPRIGVMVRLDLDDDAANAVEKQRGADRSGADFSTHARKATLDGFAQGAIKAGEAAPARLGLSHSCFGHRRIMGGNASLCGCLAPRSEPGCGVGEELPRGLQRPVDITWSTLSTPSPPTDSARHPEKVNRHGRRSRRSRNGFGGARRNTRGYAATRKCEKRTPRTGCAEEGAADYRRVLGQEARHLSYHGRNLHRACAF